MTWIRRNAPSREVAVSLEDKAIKGLFDRGALDH